MRGRRSFESDLTLWTAGIFVVLYLAASCAILVLEGTNDWQQLQDALHDQAEALASYQAASGRMDFPELHALETDLPIPVWLRVVRDGQVLAATPGFPGIPVEARAGSTQIETLEPAGNGTMAMVRHPVWTRPGVTVEAVTSTVSLRQRRLNLAVILGVAGLLLAPLAALGGRVVAARALRPLKEMVVSVRTLAPEHFSERLTRPSGVRELEEMRYEFNALLSRLEESVNRVRRFTADASHELRTPVSILRTGLEVALRRERTAEEYRSLLRENLVEIERVQRIVEGLLALAREESQGGSPGPGLLVDLAPVVESALQSVAPLATQKQVALTSSVERSLEVLGDPDRLRLMLLNLLDNAIKHTPPGREVAVALERQGEDACLRVADQGPGVSPGDRPFIFDRFFRGQGAPGGGSGTGGLGLSLVRWVAEGHGGQVQLLDREGPGATFEVRVPLASLA